MSIFGRRSSTSTAEKHRLDNAVDFYPNINWDRGVAFTLRQSTKLDDAFAYRLCASYRLQIESFAGFGTSFWAAIAAKSDAAHAAFLAEDIAAVRALIADPASTNLFSGFDSAIAQTISTISAEPKQAQAEIANICDRIVCLAEAVGATRIWNPEAKGMRLDREDIETLLQAIERKLGVPLEFPNPFPREYGIQTSRGIVSYRAVQAVCQTWRIARLSQAYGSRVLEIGAGLGRNAFYARRLGLTDYTIVDLPLTTMAQAIFLANILGADAVTLPGEEPRRDAIRLATPAWLFSTPEPFDVAVNVDSMTEMDRAHAERYAQIIASRARVFLSINHEANDFTVSELKALAGPRFRNDRHPNGSRSRAD